MLPCISRHTLATLASPRSKQTSPVLAALVVALLSAATGCSSASNPAVGPADGGADSGPSAAQACADQAHATCAKRDTCSLNAFLNKVAYGDEATCETRAVLSCVPNLGANGTAQSPTRIEACVAQFPSYACPDFLDGNPSGACLPAAGTGAIAAACGTSSQCASTYCAIPQYHVCGTCQPLPVAGATCQSGADCGRNLACATPNGSTTGTCAAYVAANGACLNGSQPCASGLGCVGDVAATSTMGTCQPLGSTVGAACDSTRKTKPNCEGSLGLVCVPASAGSMGVGTCQAITLVAAGAPCGDIGSKPITGFADCQAGGLCVKATGASTGTCVAPAADGAACDSDSTKGPPCLAPAKCAPSATGATVGTCTIPDATKCM